MFLRCPLPPRRLATLAGAVLTAAVVMLPVARGAPLARVDVSDRAMQQSLEIHRHRGRQYVVGQPGNE